MTTLIEKLETKIPGLDAVAAGGLPLGRATLVSGTAGSGKTVLGAQFIAAGIQDADQSGVFVTFEEPPEQVRRNMMSLGWPITEWEQAKQWAFVDASPQIGDASMITGDYDMGALLARIEYAVNQTGAKRVTMDSIGALFAQFEDHSVVRHELFRIVAALRQLGVTSIITGERTEEYGDIGRFGVEEFVTDNVIVLRNVLENEKRRRTLEILKFRGTSHQKGEYPFTIIPNEGVVVIPLSAIELTQRSSYVRITSGNASLDAMCGGGFFRDSILLVSGATGTGKTLMTTEFVAGGVEQGEKVLLFAFEESKDQLNRNAIGWGKDFQRMEEDGKLRVVCTYPETQGLEDHLIDMKRVIDEFQPDRVAIDSLSALERVSTERSFREFVISLTSFIKHKEVAGLFTATTATLMGGSSVTEAHISTITDSIILLRYVEMLGEMKRGITVLKMRGSMHDKDIREFSIDDRGMHIGRSFRNVAGIISGHPRHVPASALDPVGDLFADEAGPMDEEAPK